jgi:hypothetical protein
VHKLISWKHSFTRLNEEYEVARKKRQALDSLLNTGRISQSTHVIFNREIDEAIADIERQQKGLLEKMATKVVELEGQVKTLEILLANFEIRHVTGDIDEDTYQRENDLLTIGLDQAKHELEEVKEAADQLASGELPPEEDAEPAHEEHEVTQPEVKFLEETATADDDKVAKVEEEPIVEAVTCAEATSKEAEEKTEDKQET